MYLTKIELTNFQSHKSTTINLAGGFVCIAGKTRSGKSSVLRALNFMFNDVWSDSFIRTGEKSVIVSVTLDNGIKVLRQKGSGINHMEIIYPDNTKKTFDNFGIQAPLEVKNILGIFPLVIDSDYSENINIHMQDDSHFLLTKSAPMKTKFINRLTRLHVIDAVNRDIAKELQDTTKSIDTLTKQENSLKETVNGYGDVESKISFYKDIQEKLTLTTKAMEALNLKYDKLFILATRSAEYLRMKALFDRRKKIINKISGIQGLINNYGKVQKILLLFAKQEHLKLVDKHQNELLQEYKNLDNLYKQQELADSLMLKVNEYNQLKALDKQQQEIITACKEHTKVCPTCKRPLWEAK